MPARGVEGESVWRRRREWLLYAGDCEVLQTTVLEDSDDARARGDEGDGIASCDGGDAPTVKGAARA